MTDAITLTEEQFDERYPLLTNHLNPNASWATGDGPGCLFETYGEELAFVRSQDPRTVWTLIDGDDGNLWLVSGLHFVNRIGYLISTVALPENHFIEVQLETNSESEGVDPCPAIPTTTDSY